MWKAATSARIALLRNLVLKILINPDRITHNKPSNILKHCQFRYSPTCCSLQINCFSPRKPWERKTIKWATNMAKKRKVKNQTESERERSKEIRKKGLCACAKNKLLHYIQLARKYTLHVAQINFSHSHAYWLWPKTSPKIIEEL